MSEETLIAKYLQPIGFENATKRQYPESLNPDQSPFGVDEGRIVFSPAFRLLSDKTQVHLTNPNSQSPASHWVCRNRGSHSMEVFYTARRIAKALGLNNELAGVIALGHDLGHPPFGHAGEKELNNQMKQYGEDNGFDHDVQTLRLVTKLLSIRPDYSGLNLTDQVLIDLASRAKRSHNIDICVPETYPQGFMSLEAQCVEIADKLSFIVSDTEDAMRIGDMIVEELLKCPFLANIFKMLKSKMTAANYENTTLLLSELKKSIYNYFLKSMYRQCQPLSNGIKKLQQQSAESFQPIFITTQRFIVCEPTVQEEFDALLNWFYENYYKNKMVERDRKATYTINTLFSLLYHHENLCKIYNQYQIAQDPNESLARHVTDLIVMSGESFVHKFFNNVILA